MCGHCFNGVNILILLVAIALVLITATSSSSEATSRSSPTAIVAAIAFATIETRRNEVSIVEASIISPDVGNSSAIPAARASSLGARGVLIVTTIASIVTASAPSVVETGNYSDNYSDYCYY